MADSQSVSPEELNWDYAAIERLRQRYPVRARTLDAAEMRRLVLVYLAHRAFIYRAIVAAVQQKSRFVIFANHRRQSGAEI